MRRVPASIAPIAAATALALLVALPATPARADTAGGPTSRTFTDWDRYVAAVERRVDGELGRANGRFLVLETLPQMEVTRARAMLDRGEVYVHEMAVPAGLSRDAEKGLVHHWLGAVLVPGATVDQVLAFVQDYDHHARHYADVMASKTLARDGDRFRVFLKLQRSRFGVNAHYNTEHDVVYRRHDPARASSRSVATRIAELDDAGKPREREKAPGDDRGYLWRLNSYWRFQQTAAGVVVECESVSLSRDIPWPVRFLAGPFVRSVPRDSLDRTLSDMRAGISGRGRAR